MVEMEVKAADGFGWLLTSDPQPCLSVVWGTQGVRKGIQVLGTHLEPSKCDVFNESAGYEKKSASMERYQAMAGR
jgi:hypothetical protein